MRKAVLFGIMATMASLAANADTVVATKTYVDAKVVPQGSTSGSIFSASSPDDKAPSAKAVYTALDAIDGTAYTAGTGIGVANHVISNTGVTAVATGREQDADGTISVTTNGSTVGVAVKGLAAAAYKSVTTDGTLADAAAASGEHSSDYAKLPTAGAVKAYAQQKLPTNDSTTNPNGSLVAYGTTAGVPATKKIVTTVAQGGTDIPTDGAVYAVKAEVDALAACKHTCANANCTLITVSCVDSYVAPSQGNEEPVS